MTNLFFFVFVSLSAKFYFRPSLFRISYFNSFDFVASFSSIEHSGLGRYNDPLDPIGDIREMQKISCMLKPGGLFFLGIPVGQDDVGHNCHRTYGRIRLPMMFAGEYI
uniref:DUF268 domain-containing protein n=1 Tax=Meloidogyne incognita TaxID=6306 RepID=A0A914L5V3_MELIC